ncbi:MAG TPA: glycosyltransferase [Thermoanaerobaculia bacterium]|nr:glycosyltransferase [Thermoanaerobaculia bacterium]
MKFVLFYHSLVSDWNHGNAHFLRGIVAELQERGHEVDVYEPADAWSVQNLVKDHGTKPLEDFQRAFPHLRSIRYDAAALDLRAALTGTDVVIVHEWNDPALVRRIGEERARMRSFHLYFHDTHHRAATEPEAMSAYDLSQYDGVLAYGQIIRDLYLERGWARQAWTWHEAADVRLFHPRPRGEPDGDVVWIGNWGDDERTAELHEFLIEPVRKLGLRAKVYGVRYPIEAIDALHEAGIEYGGWLPNHRVPEVFSRYRLTVHVPRRPYVTTLKGIPTIRPFEALACAIPLISAPWDDAEGLFTPGEDFLVARNGAEMRRLMRGVLQGRYLAHCLAENGLRTILRRHTCAHRLSELMRIIETTGETNACDWLSSAPAS